MLRFLSVILALTLLSAPAEARRKKEPVLENNKAYVFYLKSCPMCRKALKHIDERYLSRPDVVRVDLAREEGRALLQQCVQKFGIKGVVIPVFCIGDKYFMGWSGKAAAALDSYIVEMHGG